MAPPSIDLVVVDQGASPLGYHHAAPVHRFALVAADAASLAPPVGPYFAETTQLEHRHPETGRKHRKAKRVPVPGAAPGTVAFLDWHHLATNRYGGDDPTVAIDYMAVRPDMRGKRISSAMVGAFFTRVVLPARATSVEWGEVWSPEVWHLFGQMRSKYPEVRQYGKPMGRF
jgi:GNAT superfamily N-acetyltransferase